MKKTFNTVEKSVTFTFDGLEAVTLKMADVTEANRTYGMLHGFAARIGDNTAIKKCEENNYTVTEQMRREAVMELVTHYQSGSEDWNIKSGPRAAKQNPTILALATKAGITYAEMEAKLADMDVAELMG